MAISAERRHRRLLHRPVLRYPLAWMASGYMRLLARTGTWQVVGDPANLGPIREGRPALGAFFHARMLMIYWVWRAMLEAAGRDVDTRNWALISTHGDGAFVADAMRRLGIEVVHGSARRGGTEAWLRMRQLLTEGRYGAIATDGPRGPRMRVKPGIVHLARATGVPIYPVTSAASNQYLVNSWDRFALYLPFARGVLAWGDPVSVPHDAGDDGLEAVRQELERRLIDLTHEADRLVGRPPVEPAPPVGF
jgi:lysophospholipid acyltransferase (LPLAT)-like uncharacterized protein